MTQIQVKTERQKMVECDYNYTVCLLYTSLVQNSYLGYIIKGAGGMEAIILRFEVIPDQN